MDEPDYIIYKSPSAQDQTKAQHIGETWPTLAISQRCTGECILAMCVRRYSIPLDFIHTIFHLFVVRGVGWRRTELGKERQKLCIA